MCTPTSGLCGLCTILFFLCCLRVVAAYPGVPKISHLKSYTPLLTTVKKMNNGTISFQFAENGRVHHINMGLDTSVEQSGEQQDSSFRTEQVVRFLKGPQKVRARILQYSGSVRTFNSHRDHREDRELKAWGRVDGASQMFHGVMDVYANRSQDEPEETWYLTKAPPELTRIPIWTRATAIFNRGDEFEEFLEIFPPGYSSDTAEANLD